MGEYKKVRIREVAKRICGNLVSLALGHSDISTTGIYIKGSPQDLLKHYQEGF